MGNCQAAEAATVVIVHPGGKIERIYWSTTATLIMNSNPGHYVAQVVSTPGKSQDGKPLKHLKLLRPDDTLHIGHVYRLISFEDVLKEFAAKKCVKLGKLIKETAGISTGEVKTRKQHKKGGVGGGQPKATTSGTSSAQVEHEPHRPASSSSSDDIMSSGRSSRGVVGRHQPYQAGQWRPALQSIAEVGS